MSPGKDTNGEGEMHDAEERRGAFRRKASESREPPESKWGAWLLKRQRLCASEQKGAAEGDERKCSSWQKDKRKPVWHRFAVLNLRRFCKPRPGTFGNVWR